MQTIHFEEFDEDGVPKKPGWIDVCPDGKLKCDRVGCEYACHDENAYKQHKQLYHPLLQPTWVFAFKSDDVSIISDIIDDEYGLFYTCVGGSGSEVYYKSIQSEGSTDFIRFCENVTSIARKNGAHLKDIWLIHEPHLFYGLLDWWIDGGVQCGVFHRYSRPLDVRTSSEYSCVKEEEIEVPINDNSKRERLDDEDNNDNEQKKQKN